jgi:hypothetical protein
LAISAKQRRLCPALFAARARLSAPRAWSSAADEAPSAVASDSGVGWWLRSAFQVFALPWAVAGLPVDGCIDLGLNVVNRRLAAFRPGGRARQAQQQDERWHRKMLHDVHHGLRLEFGS